MMSQRLCQCLIGSSDGYIQYKSTVRVFSTGASSKVLSEYFQLGHHHTSNSVSRSIMQTTHLLQTVGTSLAQELQRKQSNATLPRDRLSRGRIDAQFIALCSVVIHWRRWTAGSIQMAYQGLNLQSETLFADIIAAVTSVMQQCRDNWGWWTIVQTDTFDGRTQIDVLRTTVF